MVGSMLLETCPTCKSTVGAEFVAELDFGDDLNVREKVIEYKEHQKGFDPYRCPCGTNLVPSVSIL